MRVVMKERFAYISLRKKLLTAFMMSPFIVPDRAAAIPNLPLLRMCIAILKPSPTSAEETHTYSSRYPGNVLNVDFNPCLRVGNAKGQVKFSW